MTRTVLTHAVLAAALALGACAPSVDTRGHIPLAERLEQIKPGGQTRDEVAQILGTPSTLSAFGDPVWYYIGYRTETTAFFEPEEVERKVVAVHFDASGKVSEVRQLGLENGRELVMVERETPTAGKDLTVLQQLFGNIGRFSSDGPDLMNRRTPGSGSSSNW